MYHLMNLIDFCQGRVNNSGPIVTYEPRKSDDMSCKNTFSVKKVQPSQVESYVEVNAWTDWQQDLMISEYGQRLTCWMHKYYTWNKLLFSKFNWTN